MNTSLTDVRSAAVVDARHVSRVFFSNAPFLLVAAAPHQLPEPLVAACVGAILFLIPGLAWVPRTAGDAFVLLFRTIAASLAAAVACWLPLMLLPGPTSRVLLIFSLCAVTNVGLALGFRKRWYENSPFRNRFSQRILLVSMLFWAQSYIGASALIPALEDQDMETQGTAYGLIHAFEPTMVTNRGTAYYFAHPLLQHFWVGSAALITDDLERLRYHHESAVRLRTASTAELDAQFEKNFEQFERDPVILPNRLPSIFLGVSALFPLAFIVYRLSGSETAALIAAVLYATLPEVYVRSAYGGYMALTAFITLSTAYFYLDGARLFRHQDPSAAAPDRPLALAALAGLLAALSNQKALLLPAAAAAHTVWRGLRSDWHLLPDVKGPLRAGVRVSAAIGLGFVAGWALFAAYGMMVAPDAFVADHLRQHVVDRLRLRGLNLATELKGEWAYPSIVGLWWQFASHSGWLLVPAVLLAVASAIRRLSEGVGFLAIWIVAGAAGFSIIDWRQTKHLHETIVPALVIVTAVCWASAPRPLRLVMSALLTAAVGWNAYRTYQLMRDFSSLVPTPIW